MPGQPITPPYSKDGTWTVHIDFEGNEYLLQWDGDWGQLQDLAQFPLVPNATVTPVMHSSSISDIWATSEVLNFGEDAHVRVLRSCTDGFPICKVAVNDHQRRLIRD
jgi:hypothetical protein